MKNYSEYLGKSSIYEREVILKYQLFNSLFLGLPFDANEEIGTLLLTFTKKCSDGLSHGKTAPEIVQDFFYTIALSAEEQTKLLLKFIQFIERQVVLFDALEDAAFAKINDLRGAGTIDYLMNKVQAEGSIYSHKLQQLIFNYRTRLVLTAHPTQFYPTNVLVIIGELRDAIINNNLDLIKDLILQLGLTSFVNKDKPTPIDEAKSLIWYLEHIFYFVAADIQAKLPTVNTNLEIGFWPGGDRDGNPYVTAKVTKEVAEKLRSAITKCYLRDIHNLRKRLTFNGIEEQVDAIAKKLRLNQYSLAQELLQDLEQIIIDLNHNYLSTFTHLVQEFIIKVKLFDFYFAKIDIRQNSAIHRQVVSELLQQITPDLDYANLEEEQKINLLYTSKNSTFETKELSPLAKEIIETIQVIGEVQKMNGSAAIERYIISNTDSISSILEVQWLQSIVNKTAATTARFNIVPLFETIDDLSHAETIMEYLFNLPWYQEHLQSWNNIQTIMLGFSDGTKDGGYLMANWSIFQAKKRLSKLAAKYNIQVVFFDGRGGPPSRGGGDMFSFYQSIAQEIDAHDIQLTVQGQTISANYGTYDSARFNIENLLSAGLNGKIFTTGQTAITSDEEELLAQLAQLSYDYYAELRDSPLFVPYLEKITPLKYLSEANIGSRPARRNNGSLRLEDLRAIPFGGAWMQMKQNILGYYGIGSAISALISKNHDNVARLTKLYKNSLFFKGLVDNSRQSLAQSNFAISRHLQVDAQFGTLWRKIYAEAQLAQQMLLLISGHDSLIDNNPIKSRSISERENIIMPLLIIQQYAMNVIRHIDDKSSPEYEFCEKLIKRSLAASINASRNSI